MVVGSGVKRKPPMHASSLSSQSPWRVNNNKTTPYYPARSGKSSSNNNDTAMQCDTNNLLNMNTAAPPQYISAFSSHHQQNKQPRFHSQQQQQQLQQPNCGPAIAGIKKKKPRFEPPNRSSQKRLWFPIHSFLVWECKCTIWRIETNMIIRLKIIYQFCYCRWEWENFQKREVFTL